MYVPRSRQNHERTYVRVGFNTRLVLVSSTRLFQLIWTYVDVVAVKRRAGDPNRRCQEYVNFPHHVSARWGQPRYTPFPVVDGRQPLDLSGYKPTDSLSDD